MIGARTEAVPITGLAVSAYTVPTEAPESDGTLAWTSTSVVLVEVRGGDESGLGFTYAHRATAAVIRDLTPLLEGRDALAIGARWREMMAAVRNVGAPGLAAMAIAAIDIALWDLKARLLRCPLVSLLGQQRTAVPVYGSGGFTSYEVGRLQDQLGGWVDAGIPRVKMKVGREPGDDPYRVRAARKAIGPSAELYVDANGAYDRKQAIGQAARFAEQDVTWFEEPVSSDDIDGLRLVRDRAPAGMEVAAGEYGYRIFDFRRLLESGAVDVLQADVTRCAGISGFLAAAALCEAYAVPLSCHTAPALHLHPACAAAALRHVEYFHDHVRIERLLFDGLPAIEDGGLAPDLTQPGLGLRLKRTEAERYRV